MNHVVLIGRLTAEPEVRYSSGINPIAIGRYRLAVDRPVRKEGEQTADYINIVSFGKTAEFVQRYLHKGTKIAVTGRIQTGNYTARDGQKVYTFEVVAETHEFCESKQKTEETAVSDGFMKIPENENKLPFDELSFV